MPTKKTATQKTPSAKPDGSAENTDHEVKFEEIIRAQQEAEQAVKRAIGNSGA